MKKKKGKKKKNDKAEKINNKLEKKSKTLCISNSKETEVENDNTIQKVKIN